MFHIVLVEPEIPPNTGNIARTCAATGARLHLVQPLGFSVDDRSLKRAGLDYWRFLQGPQDSKETNDKQNFYDGYLHENLNAFFAATAGGRYWYATTKGGQCYTEAEYLPGDYLLFGAETRGLPASLIRAAPERCIRIPMLPDIRSLNLSNSVAVVLYEALRQRGFPGLRGTAGPGGTPEE